MKLERVTAGFRDMERLLAINDEAFPPEERVPGEKFTAAMDELGCEVWAVYDGENMIGFADVLPGDEVAYLWFLAVSAAYHSRGYGSRILEELDNRYTQQLTLDVEPLDEAAENYEQRVRRMEFYRKNGFHETGYMMRYMGLDFSILCKEEDFRLKPFTALTEGIRTKAFDPQIRICKRQDDVFNSSGKGI